jgi:hypothetical protein
LQKFQKANSGKSFQNMESKVLDIKKARPKPRFYILYAQSLSDLSKFFL